MEAEDHRETTEDQEEFSELLRFTIVGYLGGIILGFLLDRLGFQRSGIGQWLVRTISGEGESFFEGFYALRKRLSTSAFGMAEAYGWGKFIGMTIPWWVDWASRLSGIDMYGTESFYIPFFYGMSDQIGANLSGLLLLRRRRGSWAGALSAYLHHPVMISGLILILVVPMGLYIARAVGFSPTSQTLTALETIASNLCWIPPLIGSRMTSETGR